MKHLKIFEDFDISDDEIEEIKSIFQDIADEFDIERRVGNLIYTEDKNGIYYNIVYFNSDIYILINCNDDNFLNKFVNEVIPKIKDFEERIKPLGYRLIYHKTRKAIIDEFYDSDIYTIELIK